MFFFPLFLLLLLLLLLLLTGLHVFLERLYFLRSSWVYAGGAGPQREATAGGLRCEEEKPALKEGESLLVMWVRCSEEGNETILCFSVP